MNKFGRLISQNGKTTEVYYDFSNSLENLARASLIDTYLVGTEFGFSPLGAYSDFLTTDLGISREEIYELANWNRFENSQISLIALRSRRLNSYLKGVILCSCENSLCYQITNQSSEPYRDFYYNVSYEAISYVSQNWQSQKIAISHLSASGNFHQDIATCTIEALGHFCDLNLGQNLESFAFIGCCIDVRHLMGINRLNNEKGQTIHRPISVVIENRERFQLIHLNWNKS